MSKYNALNYTEQGGAKTVIGGTLEIKSGATITGLPDSSATVKGVAKQAANVAKAAGTAPTKAEFDAVIDALVAAGLMAAAAAE